MIILTRSLRKNDQNPHRLPTQPYLRSRAILTQLNRPLTHARHAYRGSPHRVARHLHVICTSSSNLFDLNPGSSRWACYALSLVVATARNICYTHWDGLGYLTLLFRKYVLGSTRRRGGFFQPKPLASSLSPHGASIVHST